jgi:hypothetical protein
MKLDKHILHKQNVCILSQKEMALMAKLELLRRIKIGWNVAYIKLSNTLN